MTIDKKKHPDRTAAVLLRQGAACLAAVGMVTLLAACAGTPGTVSVMQEDGVQDVATRPQRTVVTDLAVLDTLHALGVDDAVAGVAKAPLPTYLAAYGDDSRYPKVGSLFEPDADAIRGLQPDLIIVGGRSAEKRDELQALAPTIDISVKPGDLVATVVENARLLAAIYKRDDQAQPLIQHLQDTARVVRDAMQHQGQGLVVLTTGGKIVAMPAGPRFGAIYETLGIAPLPIEVAEGERGKRIDADYIREQNPDWVFVIDRDTSIGQDGPSARELLDDPALRQVSAWQSGHVIYLDPVDWYVLGAGGLTSLQRGLDQVLAALVP